MLQSLRSRLSFGNVISVIALFVALGGTAMAATIITDNSQVAPDTISGHKPPAGKQANIIGGSVSGVDIGTGAVVSRNINDGSVTGNDVADNRLTGADIADKSLGGADVADNSITGAQIADRSGVDTCQTPLTAQFGPICAGSDAVARTWEGAQSYCAGFGLRLPSVSEAVTLAKNYDVPGVNSTNDLFWTDEATLYPADGGGFEFDSYVVGEDGGEATANQGHQWKTVCVTDPSA
jgi:hypothetical protein